MAPKEISQGCDLERSRSSVKVNKFSIRPPPPTVKYTCEVLLKSYCQFFSYLHLCVSVCMTRAHRSYYLFTQSFSR